MLNLILNLDCGWPTGLITDLLYVHGSLKLHLGALSGIEGVECYTRALLEEFKLSGNDGMSCCNYRELRRNRELRFAKIPCLESIRLNSFSNRVLLSNGGTSAL